MNDSKLEMEEMIDTETSGPNVISGADFDFVIHGITENDQIIVLVDDHIFGACSYALKEHDADGTVAISADVITTNDVKIPPERQKTLIEAFLFELIPNNETIVSGWAEA